MSGLGMGSDRAQTGRMSHTDQDGGTFVPRATLARIMGQDILFSADRQAIFALNDLAAAIWRAIEAGRGPSEIAEDLADQGIAAAVARDHVNAALEAWQGLELVAPAFTAAASAAPAGLRHDLAIAGLRVRVRYGGAEAGLAHAIFRHLEVADGRPQVTWDAIGIGDRLHLYREGEWIAACTAIELPTVLKGYLLTEVLERDDYAVALHAATLLPGRRAVLLLGDPGAGKTTLTMGLVHAGFGFGGDDVALLRSDGLCVALPFAPAVKPGAQRILAGRFPGLARTPALRRPDGRRVRYLVPDPFTQPPVCEVGWIVLLDRQRAGAAKLQPVDAGEALGGLLAGAFSQDGGLTEESFHLLARVIGAAEVFRLTYSDLGSAVEVLRRACR